jgi:hypothetical protein
MAFAHRSAPCVGNIRRAAHKVQSIRAIGKITGVQFSGIQIFHALKLGELKFYFFAGNKQLKRFAYALNASRERIAGLQFMRRQRMPRQGIVENNTAAFREARNMIKRRAKSSMRKIRHHPKPCEDSWSRQIQTPDCQLLTQILALEIHRNIMQARRLRQSV